MVRDLPVSAGGILSYFTRHKTLRTYYWWCCLWQVLLRFQKCGHSFSQMWLLTRSISRLCGMAQAQRTWIKAS